MGLVLLVSRDGFGMPKYVYLGLALHGTCYPASKTKGSGLVWLRFRFVVRRGLHKVHA